MANTVSAANLIAVSAKVDSMYGLEETTSALVEDTLAVNQLGDERLGHLSGWESPRLRIPGFGELLEWPNSARESFEQIPHL